MSWGWGGGADGALLHQRRGEARFERGGKVGKKESQKGQKKEEENSSLVEYRLLPDCETKLGLGLENRSIKKHHVENSPVSGTVGLQKCVSKKCCWWKQSNGGVVWGWGSGVWRGGGVKGEVGR